VKLIGRLVLGIIAVVVVIFALANRDPVTLSLWPLPLDLTMPLYIAVLGGLVVGLIAGAVISWLPKLRLRRQARAAERRADALEHHGCHAAGPPQRCRQRRLNRPRSPAPVAPSFRSM